MAIFRLSMEPLSRKAGRSATAAAAYRAGAKIHDLRTGQTWDFTRRRGVEHTEIVLPARVSAAAAWARDRSALWNAAELIEKRKDARTAREYGLALPHELTREQQIGLVQRFAHTLADRYGIAVDVAIHQPHSYGDKRNVHAHLLATTRQVTGAGLGAKSAMEWSDTDLAKRGLASSKRQLVALRNEWADLLNAKFAELGLAVRVDHRTLEAQGIEREATSHLGPRVSAMQRRGLDTEVVKRIREEQRRAAERRVTRLRESRTLERERAAVAQSIVDVSADLAAARRDVVVHQPSVSLEDIRRQAREEWRALRAQRQGERPEASQSIEEVQRRARERWRDGLRTGHWDQPEAEREVDREAEKKKAPDRDHGIDDDDGP